MQNNYNEIDKYTQIIELLIILSLQLKLAYTKEIKQIFPLCILIAHLICLLDQIIEFFENIERI